MHKTVVLAGCHTIPMQIYKAVIAEARGTLNNCDAKPFRRLSKFTICLQLGNRNDSTKRVKAGSFEVLK